VFIDLGKLLCVSVAYNLIRTKLHNSGFHLVIQAWWILLGECVCGL